MILHILVYSIPCPCHQLWLSGPNQSLRMTEYRALKSVGVHRSSDSMDPQPCQLTIRTNCYDSIFTFTFLPIQTMNIYFLFTSFEWTMQKHCSLFWSNNRTMHLHYSFLLIVQRLDWTMVYHCSLVSTFHCLYKYINSSSLQLVLQLVFNKDLYQLNELKTIPLTTKALFCLEQTRSQTTG